MATAFTHDYNQFNPDPVLGPNTWVLNSAGLNPGGGGGTTSAYVFTAAAPIVQTTVNGATKTVNTTFVIPTLPTLTP